MTRERRLQTREIPAELAFIQINRDEGGRILNICENGLSFETFAPIERERLLRFWFSLNLRERIEASGRLAWLDADGKVGGLRFLELSAKARRHLRTHLAAELSTQLASHHSPEPGTQPNVALRPQLVDSVKEKQREKGSLFFAALAKRAPEEVAVKPQVVDGAALENVKPATTDVWSNSGLQRSGGQPAEGFGSTNLIGMVALERYLTTSRRQFRRGILVGALVSLALAIASVAGWYFVRRPAAFRAGPSATLPGGATPGAAASAGSGVHDGQSTEISSSPSADRQPSRSSPNNPPRDAVFLPSASSSEAVRGTQKTATAPRESDAKLKKATPQQLWAQIQGGNARAAVELADRYLQGNGVPVNCDQARILLLVASEKNNADAIQKLRELDKTEGCPTPPTTGKH